MLCWVQKCQPLCSVRRKKYSHKLSGPGLGARRETGHVYFLHWQSFTKFVVSFKVSWDQLHRFYLFRLWWFVEKPLYDKKKVGISEISLSERHKIHLNCPEKKELKVFFCIVVLFSFYIPTNVKFQLKRCLMTPPPSPRKKGVIRHPFSVEILPKYNCLQL